ncbi:MAG: histidinol dehydrogenase [Acidimicrobiia bacterium]|nr:histidinol dehydrogenase [Acidimicrobiia bacterium]MDH5292634.1 histidinol dehydrogenase [Acidimicrobiia bacterium]
MPRLRNVNYEAMTAADRRLLLARSAVPDRSVRDGAVAICDDVAERGDVAVSEYAERFGGGFRRVTNAEVDAACNASPPGLISALEAAAGNVEAFHRAQLPRDLSVETVEGVQIVRKWTPLRRVGAYVPGGKAAYPSTVIMTAVPARVAGVEEVVVASPAADDGTVDPAVLAACRVAGVDEIWVMGGAQAVAALAYGTETVRRVEKIVGPGSAWVTAAKLAVYGVCAIDLPAGPSEVLVIADGSADPRLVAVDLLCQAEHGPDSPALLVTTSGRLVDEVEAELDSILPELARASILEQALTDHGWAITVADLETAVEFANDYAGEHVTIMTEDPDSIAKAVTGAGSVYVGRWSPESAGDYATGANHVLPTGGLAAACGPLSVQDFGSWRQEQRLTEAGLGRIVDIISTLATAEGLTAHRLAAETRLENR